MKEKDYVSLSGVIFAIVAVLHAVRLFAGWEVIVAGYSLPLWFSFFGVAFAGYLAYSASKLKK